MTRVAPFTDDALADAFRAMLAGEVIRTVIRLGDRSRSASPRRRSIAPVAAGELNPWWRFGLPRRRHRWSGCSSASA